MSTETVTLEPHSDLNLNLGALHSVLLVKSHPWVQDAHTATASAVGKARQYRVVDWAVSLVQLQLLWTWTLLHTVPWPTSVVGRVYRADAAVTPYLQGALDKIEWWVDYATITSQRLLESTVALLFRSVTLVDQALAWVSVRAHHLISTGLWLSVAAKKAFDMTSSLASAAWTKFRETVHGLQRFTEHKQGEETREHEKKEE